MPAVIKIRGLEELTAKLGKLEGLRAILPAMKAAAEHIQRKVKEYPPETEANSPSQQRWYQRGYGPKWRTKSGAIHGSNTSKTLKHEWTIGTTNGGLTQIVGNQVTYGPFVQDKEKQADFHKRRGWKTTEDVAEEEADTVMAFVQKEVDKALE